MKSLIEADFNNFVKVGDEFFRFDTKARKWYKTTTKKEDPTHCGLESASGDNMIKNFDDLKAYDDVLFSMCIACKIKKCPNLRNLKYFIRFMANEALQDKVVVNDLQMFETIDLASGGGCLVAKAGTYEGDFKCYDINNSYNKFFMDYKMPTNPTFRTVETIEKMKDVCLYRVDVDGNHQQSDDLNKMLKLRRQWFTGFDLKLFDKLDIKYKLVKQENNMINFDRLDADFSFLEKINQLKQSKQKTEENKIALTALKTFLSGFWGVMCRFDLIEAAGGEIDRKYFHQIYQKNGNLLFKNPESIYRYKCAIVKPFIMAYARSRIVKQITKCTKKGYQVVYSHTDSIITDAPAKYFDIGTDIGEWKIVENENAHKGVTITNIAVKNFF